MKCTNCNQAQLVPTTFLYERIDPDGRHLQLEVSGFECPNCDDRLLTGADAERISRDWFALPKESPTSGATLRALRGRKGSQARG